MKMIYLDYTAATPVDDKVIRAMIPYFKDNFYNPSASYLSAKQVREDYEFAKHKIAQTIGAKSAEIIFTSGATESINLAFNFLEVTPKSQKTVLITEIEHPAVLECAKSKNASLLKVDKTGLISLDDLKNNITDDTQLISIGYANNEIGTVEPIKEISMICNKVRADRLERGIKTKLYFHTDASQAPGLLDINVARLGVDMMTLNSAKCYGPKGVGLLYVGSGVKLKPLIKGGGQEMNLRSGTENVPGVIGFSLALEIAEKKRKSEVKRLEDLRNNLKKYLINDLGCEINENKKHHISSILNFSLTGLDGERLVYALDSQGILVATGSACQANKGLRSYVLHAIGLESDKIDGSIRLSFGRDTKKTDIEKFKIVFKEVVKKERQIND